MITRHLGPMKIHHEKNEEINLFEYWSVAVRQKKTIAVITAAAFILSLVISLLLPVYYAAKASMIPPQQGDSLGMVAASSIDGGLGGLASGLLDGKSPADLWVGILKSRNVKSAIIEKFKLAEVYGKDTLEETFKALDSSVSVEKSDEDIITVTVEDKEPERAAAIANAFTEELDRINKNTTMTSGHRMRAFVEKRLLESKAELTRLEDELKAFQERNKAVKLDDQSKAMIDAMGAVKGQLMGKEVELNTLLSYASDSNPRVEILRTEVKGLKEKLAELGAGASGTNKGVDIFIPTDRIPGLTFQYARLLRDFKVQEQLFQLLTQQYEMARITEAKDSPTVQVLDSAIPPDKKIRPQRSLIVIASTAMAFFFSVLTAFFKEYIARMKAA
jgi:tyrosine-protein kinase Etk/Wzc